ncbi:MAG TPA: SRPBCC family protein [Terriglobales bacterium]|nr:SRPBCC family protein [Terriglobales bacterium]
MNRRPIGDFCLFRIFGHEPDSRIPHAMKIHTLQSEIWVPHPREVVFDFFCHAENLEALTPHWLHFSILSPGPIEMKAGTRIRYRLRLHGLPLRWESAITAWEPPHRFVDEQTSGPYRQWIHEHRFLEHEGGTRIRDNVQYSVAGGLLVHRLLVAPDLRRIFEFRRQKVAKIFRQTSCPAV